MTERCVMGGKGSRQSWKYIVVQNILRYSTFGKKHLAQFYFMRRDAFSFHIRKHSRSDLINSVLLTDPVQKQTKPLKRIFSLVNMTNVNSKWKWRENIRKLLITLQLRATELSNLFHPVPLFFNSGKVEVNGDGSNKVALQTAGFAEGSWCFQDFFFFIAHAP